MKSVLYLIKPTVKGTGLSLAYNFITKEYNGSIRVKSEAGAGSVFIIQLPISIL